MVTERESAAIGLGALAYALLAVMIGALLFGNDLLIGPKPPRAVETIVLEAIALDDDARSTSANEGIWRSTRVLVYLGALQLTLGLAGLVVLARTLIATNKTLVEAGNATTAARDTVDAARQAERAHLWLDVSCCFVGDAPEGEIPDSIEGRERFRIDYMVRNFGRTPATDIVVELGPVNHEFSRNPQATSWEGSSHQPHFFAFSGPEQSARLVPHPIRREELDPSLVTVEYIGGKWSEGVYGTGYKMWSQCSRIVYIDLFGVRHWALISHRVQFDFVSDVEVSGDPPPNWWTPPQRRYCLAEVIHDQAIR